MAKQYGYKADVVLVDETLGTETEVAELTVVGTVVDCKMLRVRKEPSLEAEELCTIPVGAIVVIDESASTDDFYQIYTEAGVEGFCMKKYIDVEA